MASVLLKGAYLGALKLALDACRRLRRKVLKVFWIKLMAYPITPALKHCSNIYSI